MKPSEETLYKVHILGLLPARPRGKRMHCTTMASNKMLDVG
jgi:hypothetical protein